MGTDLEFVAVEEFQIAELAAFLRATFGAPPGWRPFQENVLRWKCLAPHPLWGGGRGYALLQQGRIVAHGCAMPCRFVSANDAVLGTVIVDWAAAKTVPGGGALIYQHIGKVAQCLFGVGGSEDAQRVLPRIGFMPRQDFLTYTRVLDPAAVFAQAKDKNWKNCAHFARNLLDRVKLSRHHGAWSAERASRFDQCVLPRPDVVSTTVCYRDAALLNYFLDCPAAKMEGYLLRNGAQPVGYCLLAHVRRECRIAEIWVNSSAAEDWASAYTVAVDLAADAIQVTAGCSTAVSQQALESAGFRLSGRQPIYVKDPTGALAPELAVSMSLLETDGFYL